MTTSPAPGTQARDHGWAGGALANSSQLPLSQAFPPQVHFTSGMEVLSSLSLACILTTPYPLPNLWPGARLFPLGLIWNLGLRRSPYGQLKPQGPHYQASLPSMFFTHLVLGGDGATFSESGSCFLASSAPPGDGQMEASGFSLLSLCWCSGAPWWSACHTPPTELRIQHLSELCWPEGACSSGQLLQSLLLRQSAGHSSRHLQQSVPGGLVCDPS